MQKLLTILSICGLFVLSSMAFYPMSDTFALESGRVKVYIEACNDEALELTGSEEIYIRARGLEGITEDVRIYVLNENVWVSGMDFIDVSGGTELIKANEIKDNGQILCTWVCRGGMLPAGGYDIGIDVDRDGKYDSTIDFVEGADDDSAFEVEVVGLEEIEEAGEIE